MLHRRCEFPLDAEDGIASVRVCMLRMMPRDTTQERLMLETLSKAEATIWESAEQRLGRSNPLTTGWMITQARLAIHFHPERGAGRGRVLPIVITMPHGCDLKDRTERERIVGRKYLARWGLLHEVSAA